MPKRATPTTRMMMPSLLSQFVPRASSIAETVFMRCWKVGRDAATRYAESGGGPETRAAVAGGISARTRGVGIRGVGGWDEGTDGGVGCGGTTGTDGLNWAGVFAAAGKTGSCSTGARGAGSFCAVVAAGALGVGGGKTGEGACGFWSGCCGPGCFSEVG